MYKRQTLDANHNSTHPLFSFDGASPVSTRNNPLPVMQAVGHTNQESHKVTSAKLLASPLQQQHNPNFPIYMFDGQASYYYHPEYNYASHPSLSFIDQEGKIHSICFEQEKTLFANGKINHAAIKKADESTIVARKADDEQEKSETKQDKNKTQTTNTDLSLIHI